jgi:outer membrane protein OmpA-like peptidoglycan-associated protein
MGKVVISGTLGVVMAMLLLNLGACAKHQGEPARNAPPAPLPAPHPAPPPPNPDDLLQGQLEQLGAKPGDGGWTVTLPSGEYKEGKATFAPDDEVTVGKIAELLKANLQLRVLIEDYTDGHGSRAHQQRLSQRHADAVLHDLTTSGVDATKIQAQGRVDDSQKSRVKFIFSNAAGEFRPAPVENS